MNKTTKKFLRYIQNINAAACDISNLASLEILTGGGTIETLVVIDKIAEDINRNLQNILELVNRNRDDGGGG